jgi:hypothetical protein
MFAAAKPNLEPNLVLAWKNLFWIQLLTRNDRDA